MMGYAMMRIERTSRHYAETRAERSEKMMRALYTGSEIITFLGRPVHLVFSDTGENVVPESTNKEQK